MKYNLIVVDDHKMFLEGLVSILDAQKEYNIVLTAKDGKHIIKYLEINPESKIDLIITDISMPEIDGIMLNKAIKEKNKRIKTLVVSMHEDPEMIDDLIEQNVDGYIHKDAEKEEFFLAVKNILRGGKYFSEKIKSIYLKHRLAKKKDEEIKLSKREVEVIKLIAQEYTTLEIADKLFLSKHTIESYRKRLITKLNVRNLAGLTKYALKMKYIQP